MPNLDRLPAEGLSLHNYYVTSPVCSPSRVTFLTGHYPARETA
jgi:Arylsulfatase A and related enzymes